MKRNIINLVCFVLAIFAMSCSSSNNSEKWYVGGTLHKSTVSEWKSATEKNKLATCADFVANIKSVNNSSYNGDTALMRKDATQMLNCIEESIKGNAAENQNLKIAEIATMCAVLMNPQK